MKGQRIAGRGDRHFPEDSLEVSVPIRLKKGQAVLQTAVLGQIDRAHDFPDLRRALIGWGIARGGRSRNTRFLLAGAGSLCGCSGLDFVALCCGCDGSLGAIEEHFSGVVDGFEVPIM